MVERSPKDPHADASFDGDVPSHIGPFRILERIGAGGMGVVYLAERREPVEQRAALKVIRTDRLDKTYRARFAMEQKALARMDHPNIARLLDAGDADGKSWFAMEYVPGTPLSDYCREHRLSVEARLALFVQICDGVQHAHMKGILHRDLKPANVLVREIDGRPVAKIIDFGLAQPTDPLQIRATLHESMRQIVGTFAYMSPEQAQRTEGDLDTRTDVYSLGVVLYELLTGDVPLDIAEAERRGIAWIGDYLREHEPKKPSTRLSTGGDRVTEVAAERATTAHRLRSVVRGDLDWVTMKALARDRQRRYPTVRELGREVERVLRHEPVEAGPPGGWYRTKKWLRRHARAVGGAAVTALAVAAVWIWTDVAAARARAAEVRRELLAAASYAGVLVHRARDELWPATVTIVPLIDEWIAAADRVGGMEPHLVALQHELEREEAGIGGAPDLVRQSQLRTLGDSRDAFAKLRAMRVRVEGRRRRAIDEERLVFAPHRETWAELARSGLPGRRYGGMKLELLPGLVPLGLNPKSECYEFYMPVSAGAEGLPQRDANGDYAIRAHTGLIFVLVPGGEFRAPVHAGAGDLERRKLKPFLISRYEMTQAQLARLAGETWTGPPDLHAKIYGNDPDGLQARAGVPGGRQPAESDLTWDATMWVHPTQQVSWEEATRLLPRWRLGLPTVAQWRWAANGCVEDSLHFAWVPAEVGAVWNFLDDARKLTVRDTLHGASYDWSSLTPRRASATWDGFSYTSPVDALAANPFGLHAVFGNVSELTRDGYGEPWPRPPDGADECCGDAAVSRRAMAMGGNFSYPASLDGAVFGRQLHVENIEDWVGVRPVYLR